MSRPFDNYRCPKSTFAEGKDTPDCLCACVRVSFSFAAEGYLVTGLMDGRVVAWEAKRSERPPTEILSIDAHKGAVTALSFPKQVR